MAYISQSLTFEVDKIHYTEGDDTWEVMMDWEDSLMSASAAYICEGGGDILEIGFGMGISANYVQQHTINSHTIIENHPDMIPKAQAWAADKSNVTIVEGDWYSVKDTLSTYDGLFLDTWGDQHMDKFSASLSLIDIRNSQLQILLLFINVFVYLRIYYGLFFYKNKKYLGKKN